MRCRSIALLLAASSMTLFEAGAARGDPDILQAGKSLELVVAVIGRLKAASHLCAYGGMERWEALVEAIDKRYARCVDEDFRWSQLMQDSDRKDCEARPKGSCGVGSVNVWINFDGDVRRVRTTGVTAFCEGFPWKWVLEPGPENAKAKADYVKADPQNQISQWLTVFDAVEAIGRKLDWLGAPCDTSFW